MLLAIVMYHEIFRIQRLLVGTAHIHTQRTHAHIYWHYDAAVSLLKRVATRRNVL